MALGVPDVAARGDAGVPYQREDQSIARALQRVGQQAMEVGAYFDDVVADDSLNQFRTGVTNLLRGDPNTPQDFGYLGKKGRLALDDEQNVVGGIDDLYQQIEDSLVSPQQKMRFRNAASAFRTDSLSTVSSHALAQTQVYASGVNATTMDTALRSVVAMPDDVATILNATADLIDARVKQAELEFGIVSPEMQQSIIAHAKQDVLKTQIETIGATDPGRALGIVEKNQALLGTDYDQLYTTLRARAADEIGKAAGTDAYTLSGQEASAAYEGSYANPGLPIYQTAVQSVPGGFSSDGLARLVQIESAGNPNAKNGKHIGLTQFSPETWGDFGLGGDRLNPADSIMAAQRYAVSNAAYLTKVLGRPPTEAELYLAHQQGPGGAAKLLGNPDAPARDLVGLQAVIQNGGRPDMTAGEFAALWTRKFDGTAPGQFVPRVAMGQTVVAPSGAPMSVPVGGIPESPDQVQNLPPPVTTEGVDIPGEVIQHEIEMAPQAPTPDAIRAAAYERIANNPDLDENEKLIAYNHVDQLYTAQRIIQGQTEAAKKEASDQAANGYMTKILMGQITPELQQQIASDPNLDWNVKSTLTNVLLAQSDNSTSGATAAYGSGYWSAYEQILLPPGSPGRIASTNEILMRAGPGGDLTPAGAARLLSVLTSSQKSTDQNAIANTQAGLIRYAKSKLSFEINTGTFQLPDPEGEAIFNSRFLPKFYAAYDAWIAADKDPWEFLTEANIDGLVQGLRSPQEMAMKRLLALSVGSGVDPSMVESPIPAPVGVDPNGWKLVMLSPPVNPREPAARLPFENWGAIVDALRKSPTPKRIEQFDAMFGASGVTADVVLDVLGVEALAEEPAPPVSSVPFGTPDPGLPVPGTF